MHVENQATIREAVLDEKIYGVLSVEHQVLIQQKFAGRKVLITTLDLIVEDPKAKREHHISEERHNLQAQ